jgi:L-alanine-DL-glutamate epimerase-like enolase superfamily enzyme
VALAITDGETEAMAEAAPLPGVSPESIDHVERALAEVRWSEITLDGEDPLSIAARVVDADAPSARFAVEAVLLDLAGRRSGLSVASLIADGAPAATVATAALLDGLDTALTRARSALAAGAGALKVKIGRSQQTREEIALLRALRDELGPGVRIRADANGALSPGDPRLDALAEIGAEMIEDPFATLDEVLAATLATPVALDELLAQHPSGALRAIERRKASVVVVKPAVLGGIGRSLAIAEAARERGARAIVSHVYDPPRAFAACAHLALALGGDDVHGLARYAGIDAWRTADGRAIPVPELIAPYHIDPPDSGGLG